VKVGRKFISFRLGGRVSWEVVVWKLGLRLDLCERRDILGKVFLLKREMVVVMGSCEDEEGGWWIVE
jgi:hypothetical protein